MKLYCWKHHHFSHASRINVKPNSSSWWWRWRWSIAKKKIEERFGVCPAEPSKKRGFGKRFGRDLGCFFEEFLHIVFSKMAMAAIIDFLNHRHWLCLAHSHHSHLWSRAMGMIASLLHTLHDVAQSYQRCCTLCYSSGHDNHTLLQFLRFFFLPQIECSSEFHHFLIVQLLRLKGQAWSFFKDPRWLHYNQSNMTFWWSSSVHQRQ